MPLYKINDVEAPEDAPCRLVKASSAAAALRHAAGTRFKVDVVMNAVAAADILTSGVVMEVAGEEAPPPAEEEDVLPPDGNVEPPEDETVAGTQDVEGDETTQVAVEEDEDVVAKPSSKRKVAAE